MFEGSLPEVDELTALDDAALVDAAGGWAKAENAACARKLAVMAELFARRTGLEAGERELWWADPEAAVGAELGAAQGISTWMALSQAHRGVVLSDRLPKVAALFEAGLINEAIVRTIEYRTGLVTDAQAIAAVDALVAEQVTAWGPLSVRKTEQAVDAIVDRVDPAALRRSRNSTCTRDVEFGSPSDEPGFTSMWTRLYAPDGVVLKQRLEEMARGVCEDDPRTLGERRSDALAAIAVGIQELACQCGATECPAAAREVPTTAMVIHVVADAATVAAARGGPAAPTPPTPTSTPEHSAVPPAFCRAPAAGAASAVDASLIEQSINTTPPDVSPTTAADLEAPECDAAPPAFVIGAGVMPARLLTEFVGRATVREIRHPGNAPPEPHYSPSRGLADFVRSRDLTCRFPGCDQPATRCDLDHTVPYPLGPTHASNIKCLCRFHHLLKTFWGGWADRQLPDGTVIWMSPTGHTYTTHPGSALLFPALCLPTGELGVHEYAPRVEHNRGAAMPKRKRTRAEGRARRIEAERRLNDDYVAERNKPPPF